jgi:hypothetical protein
MRYYVNENAQPNGDHEVHTSSCSFLPMEANRLYLGDFSACGAAVIAAKKVYAQSNGCFFCARACNTG